MKLHYNKILLFSFPLNILENNINKPYLTTRHTSTTTSRVLSECDLYMRNYDNDPDMKSVKENLDRQTSQRFEEYNKRMITTRQKYKEQRDKDIKQIIVKDKIQKSLEENVEKVCLRCGFGLGGVAAGVGIIGPVAVKGWTNAAMLAAAQKGIEEGIKTATEGLGNIVGLSEFNLFNWAAEINGTNFFKQNSLVDIVNKVDNMCTDFQAAKDTLFCRASCGITSQGTSSSFTQTISQEAAKAARVAGEAAKNVETAEIGEVTAASTHFYSAIGYSVLAILIILLIMIIIYLILRYRRKKKMNKKLQYTKLLNQ
ncbi:PIR protein, putative [Plasmodium sp.]|nr:PIR protein, putative [Plasmodium sp.]